MSSSTIPQGGDHARKLEAKILKALGVDPNKVVTNTIELKPIGTNGFIVTWQGSTFADTPTIQRLLEEHENETRPQ